MELYFQRVIILSMPNIHNHWVPSQHAQNNYCLKQPCNINMHNRISLEQKSNRQKKRAKFRILQTCAIKKVKNICNCSLTKKSFTFSLFLHLQILGWPKRQIKLRHRNKENNMELCTIWSLKRMKDAWSLYTAHLFIWGTWITIFLFFSSAQSQFAHGQTLLTE